MSDGGYTYFDEAYFQRGWERGTAYSNYLEGSRLNPVFHEIASACAALEPKRALEIGCATGIVVRLLNEKGIEAHGIDVSDWAIANREHVNVQLAGAEKLPFPDRYFDLVYSVHSLEHIPDALKDAVFSEIARVSKVGAINFHMLPMIGSGPYRGDRDTVIQNLRKDPTHNLIFEKSWWLDNFAKNGLVDLGGSIHISRESVVDLSDSQLLLVNQSASPATRHAYLNMVRHHNLTALTSLISRVHAAEAGFHATGTAIEFQDFTLDGRWGDIKGEWQGEVTNATTITAIVHIQSDTPATLRFCMVGANGAEADYTRHFKPGTTVCQFNGSMFSQRKGNLIGAMANGWLFGGNGNAGVRAAFLIEAKPTHA